MSKNKKIIHIIPTLGGGGAEVLVGHIALEQYKRGYEVHIILLEEFHFTYKNYPLKDELEKKIQLHKIQDEIIFSHKKRKFINKTKKIDELILTIKPNIIHSHLYLSEIYAHITQYKNAKYFSHLHDNMFQFCISKNKTLKNNITDLIEVSWLKKQYKKFNNNFIAISKDTSEYFHRFLPKKVNKNIYTISNAINLNNYSQGIKSTDSIFRLINIGNLVPKKNHLMLINVVKELKKRGTTNIHLDILGFGPLEEKLKSEIIQNNLEDFITLNGNVSNVSEFLMNSDLYIHTAKYEPFGMVFIEAMASGLPIVCTDGKGNRDLIIDDYNGFMISDFNVEKFADSIEKIIKNDNLIKRLGQNSLEFSKEFSIEKYVDNLDDLYFNKNQYL